MFQFDLHFVQVIDLVLGSLKLFGGLLINLALILLLLVQFVDQLVLMSDLVVQVTDLMILGRLVLLRLLQVKFQILDIFLQARHFLFQFLLILEQIVPRILLFFESVVQILKLRLEIGLLSGQFQRFLHIFRQGALLPVQLPLQGIPLRHEFTVLLLELLAQLLLLLERLLGLPRLLLERGKLVLDTSCVEERFNFLPQLPPRPSTNLQILPQISLHHDQSQTLLLQLLVILPRQVTSDVGLHPGHDFAQSFVTELFHLTQHSGTEEYLGVSKTILIGIKTGRFQNRLSSLLRVGSHLVDRRRCKNLVP